MNISSSSIICMYIYDIYIYIYMFKVRGNWSTGFRSLLQEQSKLLVGTCGKPEPVPRTQHYKCLTYVNIFFREFRRRR